MGRWEMEIRDGNYCGTGGTASLRVCGFASLGSGVWGLGFRDGMGWGGSGAVMMSDRAAYTAHR